MRGTLLAALFLGMSLMHGGEEVIDPATGVRLPLFQTFWDGIKCRSLGIGPRLKTIAFISIKVYSVSMYVDEEAAKAELQRAQQSGQLESDEEVTAALETGIYTKALQMQLVRHVTGDQFTEAFDESLRPRMQGDTKPLEEFKAYFQGKQLDAGTNVVLLWRQPAALDLLLCPPGAPIDDFSKAKAGATINSLRLAQALWANYLDTSCPSPVARAAWIAGAKALASAS